MENLLETFEKVDVKIVFGIQPWQLKRIEEERLRWNSIQLESFSKEEQDNVDMIYSKHFWEKLANEFSWEPFTLALYYFENLNTIK